MSDPASVVTAETKRINRMPLRLRRGEGLLWQILLAVLLSMLCAGVLVAISGHNPVAAFAAMVRGALGSPHQIGVVLNRTTPYLLAGVGVAMCFRAEIINIGAEGQIALGGVGTAAVALSWPNEMSALAAVASLVGGAIAGAAWAAVATAIHLGRRVHEVLTTLLLNFVALLLVQQLLAGPLGQFGAGFLQSPLLPRAAWLFRIPGLDAHVGFAIALVVATVFSTILWRTRFGFAVRVAGRSRPAARYAGFSLPVLTWSVMLLAGALAGLAGGIQVLGLDHRLIEGFSLGFGFKAVTVALLGLRTARRCACLAVCRSTRSRCAFDAATNRRAFGTRCSD